MKNVCRFIPSYPSIDTIHIINFVQETQTEHLLNPVPGATYKMFYVTEGTGILTVKNRKTNFSSYLNIVRCRHACRLMEQKFTSMQDIAHLCGYNDPMYFFRVFKGKMGISPTGYRYSLKE